MQEECSLRLMSLTFTLSLCRHPASHSTDTLLFHLTIVRNYLHFTDFREVNCPVPEHTANKWGAEMNPGLFCCILLWTKRSLEPSPSRTQAYAKVSSRVIQTTQIMPGWSYYIPLPWCAKLSEEAELCSPKSLVGTSCSVRPGC